MSFDLTAHTMRQPMMDKPYKRHLATADVFNAVQEARGRISQIEREYDEAQRFLAARIAEAEIFAHLEALKDD